MEAPLSFGRFVGRGGGCEREELEGEPAGDVCGYGFVDGQVEELLIAEEDGINGVGSPSMVKVALPSQPGLEYPLWVPEHLTLPTAGVE